VQEIRSFLIDAALADWLLTVALKELAHQVA